MIINNNAIISRDKHNNKIIKQISHDKQQKYNNTEIHSSTRLAQEYTLAHKANKQLTNKTVTMALGLA